MRNAMIVGLLLVTAGCGGGPSAKSESPKSGAPAVSEPRGPTSNCTMRGSDARGQMHLIEAGYRLCSNFSRESFHSTIERKAANGRWRVVAGPPLPQPPHRDGMWMNIYMSPDRKTLLAQWGGGCEVPNAFFVSTLGGKPSPVTGERDWRKAPMSRAIGWTSDGRARVEVLTGGCGPMFKRPGTYLIDPVSGQGTFIKALRSPAG